jgi:hemerythrin-like domain-containing protein
MITFTAAPSFDHPLEMLRACHDKILRQCDTLTKLAAHLPLHGCDAQGQQAAQGILRYFETAGQFHHLDEEQDLFPALHAATACDSALLARLLSEHTVMLASWEALRQILLQLAEGRAVTLETAVMNNFIGSYTAHIALENAELLPMAARLLNLPQLAAIGREMAGRRGAKYP